MSSIAEPQVTIVVVPRERFSCTRESLESICEHTTIPFKLVYVDGGSPRHVRHYLEAQTRKKHFHLIRTDYYLSPNRARNLGLRQVNSKYVVFIDNDVVVAPGWLGSLVQCAEETGAEIVAPLICQHKPVHEIVHCAGGQTGVEVKTKGGEVERHLLERIYHQGRQVAEIKLQRQPTGLAEFHCMLVRTEIFARIGSLDEALLNTKEHVDLCMLVARAGGAIYFEPTSIVTYVPGPPLAWSDMPFYMLRWSDAWELASFRRLREKWNLSEDGYFKSRYRNLGWRRRMAITKPLSHSLTFGMDGTPVEGLLGAADKVLNRYITSRYDRRTGRSVLRSLEL
jgi:GT2 family glycosyltransferase